MKNFTFTVAAIIIAAFSLAFLTSCSKMESFSYCDLYPAGNSHAGQKCAYCHRHWGGKWYLNEGGINEAEKPCPYSD